MADEETKGNDWLDSIEVPEAEVEAPEQDSALEANVEEQVAEPEGDAVEQVEADPKQVPLRALQEEREKRQALERQFAELKARVDQPQQVAQQPQRQQAPDPYEDPEGYNAYVQSTVAQTEWKMRAEMSGRFAEDKYGKDTVEAAILWAQAEGAKDPTLGQRVQLQSSPVEFVVQEYQRSQTLQALQGKSLDDYLQEQAVAKGWIVSQADGAVVPSQQKPSSPTPPKSLSRAPGNGGVGKAPKEADWSEVKFALG